MVQKKQWPENEKGAGANLWKVLFSSLALLCILDTQNVIFEPGTSPGSLLQMQNLQPTKSEFAFLTIFPDDLYACWYLRNFYSRSLRAFKQIYEVVVF